MKLTNLRIKDLFTEEAKLTFLVGGGYSVDPPSCLPAWRAMMDAIIDYTCAESEIEGIKKLKKLRFEALVEIVRELLDKELKIIDYYGLCDKPNIQHLFLADMINRGSFVITTNFDFLIEYALQQLGVPDDDIIPVITREDFEEFQDPYEQLEKGKKTVYKIHGSTKNIITGEKTRDSLIVTIKAFGSNKEGENVFQLESFKQPAFANITENRSLVIVGYSGSDDFDIVPTLQVLKNLNNIIWINYIKDDKGRDLIYEITTDVIDEPEELDKVDQILVEIKRIKNADHVYRVYVNTSRMVKELLVSKPKLSSDNFSISPTDWFKANIKEPNEITKYLIAYKIYADLSFYDAASRCAEKMLKLSEEVEDQLSKINVMNNLGSIYYAQGYYSDAMKLYAEALHINEQLGDLSAKAETLNNIGLIYYAQGNYLEALKRYEEALQIAEQLGNLSGKATALNNIGEIYYAQGNYSEAFKRYEEALNIDIQLGDLIGKANHLNNIGGIYNAQGNYPEALKLYDEAHHIHEQLGNLSGKATALNNIGEIYYAQGNYPEALKRYEEALQIAEQLGTLSGKAEALNNIGRIYYALGNYLEALKRYEEALQIAEQLGNLSGKATALNNIGLIYYAQGNYLEALKRYEEALQIAEQLGDLRGKSNRLNNIGGFYYAQGNYSEALKRYEEALQIAEQLGTLSGKANLLENIAMIHYLQGHYDNALKLYREAMIIIEQLGDLSGKASLLNNLGRIYTDQEDYDKALKTYEEALKILTQLGLSEFQVAKSIIKNIEDLNTNERRKKIRQIVEFEHKNMRKITAWDMVKEFDIEITSTKEYLDFLDTPIDYNHSEIPELESIAKELIKQDLIRNRDELIWYNFVSLEFDLITAKKIGKFLLDNNLIKKFSRISQKRKKILKEKKFNFEKSLKPKSKPDHIPLEENVNLINEKMITIELREKSELIFKGLKICAHF